MDEGSLPVRRILMPLDLNRLSESRLPVSMSQARAYRAEIIVLHVIEGQSPAATGTVSLAEAQAQAYLDTVTAKLRAQGIVASSLIRYGDPAEEILDVVASQGIDMVILGSGKRYGLHRLLLGSVGEDVVAAATCPVLLVRTDTVDPIRLPAVRSFEEEASRIGPLAPHSLGVRTVEINRIVGSVGRSSELTASFRSRAQSDRQRYEKIRDLMLEGVSLPPISLYKLGYGYYVLDGNHRVAAAREIGQTEIEAEVTEFLPLGDARANRVFAERRSFENATGLTRIGASMPGTYPALMEAVKRYAEDQGIDDLQEAARRWEARVYQPAAREIRSLGLGQGLPGYRTADVFVHVSSLREEEMGHKEAPVSWEDALARFIEMQRSVA